MKEIKEAIESLGRNSRILGAIYEEKEIPMPDDLEKLSINNAQALALLRKAPEQPPTGNFTEKVRLNLKNWKPDISMADVRVRTIVKWLEELCGYFDTSEASRKELLEALEENYEFTKYAGAIKKINTEEYLEEFFAKGESAQKVAIAAIAKAKKE